jgi:hypothetical protein
METHWAWNSPPWDWENLWFVGLSHILIYPLVITVRTIGRWTLGEFGWVGLGWVGFGWMDGWFGWVWMDGWFDWVWLGSYGVGWKTWNWPGTGLDWDVDIGTYGQNLDT